jgi:hypothetical protein
MANSEFWRELAISFKSVPELYEFTAFRQYYMGQRYFSPTSITEPDWQLQATPIALAEFRAMAIRGATMLPPLRTSDLAVTWLEALWKEANEGPVRSGIPILGGNRVWSSDPAKIVPAGPIELRGKIDHVFQASSALCRKSESEALQIEFEENKRNDPRNWSPLRANFEAFRAIKELHARPPERIPESLVRRTIADQIGIKPEEVTPRQINLAVASLVPFYHSLELIPDSSPGAPDAPPDDQPTATHDEPKAIPPSPPEETIAEQLKRLRGECGLTIPKLAELVHIDPRTVDRHLAGESTPYPRNISAYERVFSTNLKRQVLIKKMP